MLGGAVGALGAVFTWFEAQRGPERAIVVDETGSRVLLALALALVAIGAVMLRPGPRRRWWPWALGAAALGFLGVLANWIFLLIGDDPFSITTSTPVQGPDRLALGLPLCLAGCLVAGLCAARIGRARSAGRAVER